MIKPLKSILSQPRWILATALLFVVAAVAYQKNRTSQDVGPVFHAKSGPLTISVLEGGSIEALESQVIRSEVRNRDGTKILRLVAEGYQVTDEDVANGLILVELDNAYLEERLTSQEIEFQNTLVNLTESVKEKEIQENRNLSNIKTASLKAKFALMDFQKYLGIAAAEKVLKKINLNEDSIRQLINDSHANADHKFTLESSGLQNDPINKATSNSGALNPIPQVGGILFADNSEELLPVIKDYDIDFSTYASDANEELLGDGEARQQLRKLKDDLLIAESEYALRKKTYEGGIRLSNEGFMTPNELQQKKIAFDKSENAWQAAQANLELFKTYDLQKTAEQYLLDYEQALLELSRVKKDAIAEMSDRIADLNWAKRRYNLEKSDLDELKVQMEKCIIRAERPGLVVYGDGKEEWDQDEMIREGATVRERQAIITIPDMRNMGLTVKIHESQVKRVQEGQAVRITVDAESDRTLTGTVTKVGVLPDSEDRRFNPDQKVYRTTIEIAGVHNWIKPGMTAQAEIIIRELDHTIYVPLQAVIPVRDQQVCLVQQGSQTEIRAVEVDDYNNRFAALSTGLKPGEAVLLNPPQDFTVDEDYFVPLESSSQEVAPTPQVALQK